METGNGGIIMIKGKQIQPKIFTEKVITNYRKLDALNQSMLKTFDSDPVKFFEEFKMGKKRKEKKNTALTIGNIVDFYLLECNGKEEELHSRFDEKFALLDGNKGSGQMFMLVDQLLDETESCLNEKGEATISFETRFEDAFKAITSLKDGEGNQKYFKGKTVDKAFELFEKDGQEYWQTLIANIGKTVIDVSLLDKAIIVGNKLMKDEFTKDYFRTVGGEELQTHVAIQWNYDLGDKKFITCKGEIDMLLIDNEAQLIQPMDLKTTYDNELFDNMYIKNGYYLQNAFYYLAVQKWAEENGLEKYKIVPMKFIVGDTSSNNRRPLVYHTYMKDIEAGLNGFSLRDKSYRGVVELISDIAWAEENDEWTCSREAYDNKGQMTLNIQYDQVN